MSGGFWGFILRDFRVFFLDKVKKTKLSGVINVGFITDWNWNREMSSRFLMVYTLHLTDLLGIAAKIS